MIFIKVETFYQQHPQLMVREHRQAVRAGHFAGGYLWADRLLLEHFQPGARNEFGYFERKLKYRNKKVRMASRGLVEDGGRQDLVFTGATRRSASRSKFLVRATEQLVDIPIHTPRYITMQPNRFAQHALALEILAVSERHERLVTNETGRGFTRKLREIRAQRRTTIRS